MYFKRKVYNELLNWKEKYADRYAVLLEGQVYDCRAICNQ